METKLLLYFSLLFCLTAIGQQEYHKTSFDKIKTHTGSRNYTVKNTLGKKWKLRVHFPEERDGKPILIIALHWAGTGNTYQTFHDCLVVPSFKQLNAIIVSPEGEGQLWNTQNNVSKVKQVIAFAENQWGIDSSKTVVTGYSNGGKGSWYFAEHHPELFCSAIPLASMYATKSKLQIPVYAIHGDKDELFPIQKMKKYIASAHEKGSDVIFNSSPELTHFEGCNYVTELKKGVTWLQNVVWKDN